MTHRSLLVPIIVLMLAGCAAAVTRSKPSTAPDGSSVVPARTVLSRDHPAKEVAVSWAEGAKRPGGAGEFSETEFLEKLKQTLGARGLLDAAASAEAPSLEVRLTHVRTRNTVSAVMVGFMAGADTIAGDVLVKDASGRVTDTFHVTVHYALGGRVGGQGSVRLEWMYGQFADKTASEITRGDSATAPRAAR